MILYDLRCGKSHVFEAWFKDSATFEAQAAAGQIACPVCRDHAVARAPMAPRINKGGRGKDAAPPPDRERVAMGEALKALRELRRQVEANFENVGDRFAEEARRMHYGEKELRNIYGDATPAEAETLREEGVPVERIPWVPKGDA